MLVTLQLHGLIIQNGRAITTGWSSSLGGGLYARAREECLLYLRIAECEFNDNIAGRATDPPEAYSTPDLEEALRNGLPGSGGAIFAQWRVSAWAVQDTPDPERRPREETL